MKRALPLLLFVFTFACATIARAQIPAWPKVTPPDITAAGIGVQLTGADYGNGTFVLATYFGGTTAVPTITPAVFTSADGAVWTRRTLPFTGGRVNRPRFLNGRFYLGAEAANGGNGVILSSADGIAWTASPIINSTLNAVSNFTFGNGLYVGAVSAVAASPFQVVTSPDGVTWTPRTVATGTSAGNITFFNGRFYFTVFGAATAGLYSSADGIAWTKIATAPANPGLIAASNSTLLVSFFSGSTSGQSLSSDGAAFATASPGINLTSEMIRFLNGAFVTTGSANASSFDETLVLASLDGRTWSTIASTTNQFGAAEVAFGNGRWVFVGEFDIFSGTTSVTPGGSSTGNGGGNVTAPLIAASPLPQSATVGGSVTFTFTVTGTGLSYQWLFNNALITGATNATYTIASVTTANAGNYSVRVTNAGGTVTSNSAALTVSSAPPAAGVAFLSNLSVRARAGSGSETLIVGVTVGGSPVSTAKSVLVRGVGPTLTTFGVTGVLADPVLSVLSGTTTIASNDDWGNDATITSTSAAVGAFALNAGSRDSAIFGSGLGNGSYTVQLTGKAGATGNALIELYDTAAAASITATTTRFTNLSARTFGGTGNETLIVGFTIAGTGTRRLVIRAVGPGLTAFGVTGTMPDPKIELFAGANKIGENDNWDATTLAAQQSVGAFALTNGSRDAVMVSTLNPGGYTVQITGGTTGVVLVEAYEAP